MRFERKYRIENKSVASVKQLLRFHPASFRTLYPDRQINNVYFDTEHLLTFHQNVYGKNERKKFRARWYGEIVHQADAPRLEIKIKHNELGEKDSFDLMPFALSDMKALSREVNTLIGPSGLLRPVLLNSYQRSYWISSDGRFRLTVDHQMRYHSLLAAPSFHRYLLEDDAIVVEVKYEEEDDAFVPFITQNMPFRQAKHSKYVQGVQLTI